MFGVLVGRGGSRTAPTWAPFVLRTFPPRSGGNPAAHGRPDHPHPGPLPSRERGFAPAPPPRATPRTLFSYVLGLCSASFVQRKGQPPPMKEGESWCSAPMDTACADMTGALVHFDGIYVYGPAGAEGDLV